MEKQKREEEEQEREEEEQEEEEEEEQEEEEVCKWIPWRSAPHCSSSPATFLYALAKCRPQISPGGPDHLPSRPDGWMSYTHSMDRHRLSAL